jgi:hypothetical protein
MKLISENISENKGTLTEEERDKGSALVKIATQKRSTSTSMPTLANILGSTTTPTNNIEGVEDNFTMFMIIISIVLLILCSSSSVGVLLLV